MPRGTACVLLDHPQGLHPVHAGVAEQIDRCCPHLANQCVGSQNFRQVLAFPEQRGGASCCLYGSPTSFVKAAPTSQPTPPANVPQPG
jgi:aspartyl-tRNA synthetase